MGLNLTICQQQLVAENATYRFFVGHFDDRWVGFATGELDDGSQAMFLFPEVADGFRLGVASERDAMRLTLAVADDPESGYGGIGNLLVDFELAKDLDQLRCPRCGELGCRERLCDDFWEPTE